MADSVEAGQYFLGKIEAVELLASALAAHLSPAIARVLLAQCEALHEKESKGVALSAYEQGFLSVERSVLQHLKQVSDAEKIRTLSDDVSH